MVIDTSKLLSGSWKTSLIGVVTAVYGVFQIYMIHDWKTLISDPTMIVLVLLALLGVAAKDSNATGGNKPVTEEAKARAASPTL